MNSKSRGLELIRIKVPSERADQLRKMAADEGTTVQALLSPVLNCIAKGQLNPSYAMPGAAVPGERKF